MTQHLLLARPGHIYLATYSSTALTIVYDLAFPGNPSWLALHPSKPQLYAVDEDTSTLHRFAFDPSSPNPFSRQVSFADAGQGLVYLEFNDSVKPTKLVGAAFSNGSVEVFDIADNKFERGIPSIASKGALGPISHIQDGAHPHQVLRDNTGRFFIVNDLGTDEILILDSSLSFEVVHTVKLPAGSGPRHGAFYPVGAPKATHYILLCELSNTIMIFGLHYETNTVQFEHISSTSSFAGQTPKTARAGAFVLTPDNQHIYITNRLTSSAMDSVAHFQVLEGDTHHPEVKLISEMPSGGILPRMFCVLNKGTGDVLVANESGEFGLVVLKRNSENGKLGEGEGLKVKMNVFMDDAEQRTNPNGGIKFVLEV